MGKVTETVEVRVLLPRDLNDAHKAKYPNVSATGRVLRAFRNDMAMSNPDIPDVAARDYTLLRSLLGVLHNELGQINKLRGPLTQRGLALLLDGVKSPTDGNLADINAALAMHCAVMALPGRIEQAIGNVTRLLDLSEFRKTLEAAIEPSDADDEMQPTG